MPRYRRQIRADFQQVYGVDLHQLWRTRQGGRILDLLDGLPRNSRYRSAILNDPEMAALMVDEEDRARQAEEPEPEFEWDPAEYSPVVIALQRVESLLDEHAVVLHQLAYQRKAKRKPKQLPKLRTAVAVERERRQAELGQSLIERFTPWDA